MPSTSASPDIDQRNATIPGWVLVVPLRLFLIAGWLRAAAEKFTDEHWWSGSGVRAFLQLERPSALPFMRPLMDGVFTSQAQAIAVVVAVTQVVIAVGLGTGWFTRTALWMGIVLNVTFIACGRVNPSAFYLVMELALLAALAPRRQVRPVALGASLVGSLVVAVAMLPFVDSLRPASLVADPAAMLAFQAVLVAVGTAVRWGLWNTSGALHQIAVGMVEWADGTTGNVPRRVLERAVPDAGGRAPLPPPVPMTAVAQEAMSPGTA